MAKRWLSAILKDHHLQSIMMNMWNRLLHLKRGKSAESLAASYLKKQGLRIIEINYRCQRGEIDLICQQDGYWVFVEVRLRTDARYGDALESVDWHKQRKLIAAAEHYLMKAPDAPCRFDVIAMNDLNLESIQWIQNAFDGA